MLFTEKSFKKFAVVFSQLGFLVALAACSSNPHKAEVLDTTADKQSLVGDNEVVAVNKDGDMIYQKKLMMAEEIRKLHNDVYETEDKVFGTRKYKTRGLYGKYADCLRKLKNDDKSDLPKLEKLDRWSDKDEEIKIGIDADKDKLAAVTEEKLKDRISKFQEYRRVLQEREDEYTDNLKNCESKLQTAKASN